MQERNDAGEKDEDDEDGDYEERLWLTIVCAVRGERLFVRVGHGPYCYLFA